MTCPAPSDRCRCGHTALVHGYAGEPCAMCRRCPGYTARLSDRLRDILGQAAEAIRYLTR
jgi:hypothetical protein